MNIRKRTLLIVVATLAALIVVVLALSQFVLLDSYNRLERQRVEQNLLRVSNAIDALLMSLRSINRDWSHWDSSYAFARGQDADFVEREMPKEILVNISVDYIMVLDGQGQIIAERAVDRETVTIIEFASEVRAALLNERFRRPNDLQGTNEGIVFAGNEQLLVAASNILTSRLQGPPGGTMIFAQRLDDARVASMAQALDLALERLLPDLSKAPESVQARAAQITSLSADNPRLIQPLSADSIEGILRVADLTGETAFYLRLVMPRDIMQQGQNTITVFTVVLVVSGVVLGGGLLALLELSVLRPLSLLSEDVSHVSAEQAGERVAVRGDDEIGLLAQAINRMLERLDEARRVVRESEERLRSVVDNAPVLIWVVSKDETITSVQGSSAKALGLDTAKVVGKNANVVASALGLDLLALRQALRGQATTSATLIDQSQFVTHYQPLFDSRGEVTVVLGVATDVSKSRQSAEEIQEAYHSLAKKIQQLERVQTLIVSTLGQLDDALQRTAPRDELKQYVRFARERLEDLS